jgi:hypothetical protein
MLLQRVRLPAQQFPNGQDVTSPQALFSRKQNDANFAEALLACCQGINDQSCDRVALALPRMPYLEKLVNSTEVALDLLGIGVFWVGKERDLWDPKNAA